MKDKKQNSLLQEIPKILPVIPTMDVVVFPNMVVPLLILDEKIAKGVQQVMETHKKVLLLAAKEQPENYQGPIGVEDLYSTGTVANIMRVMDLPDGGIKVLTQGIAKARVEEMLQDQDVLRVEITPEEFKLAPQDQGEIEKQMKMIISIIEKISSSGREFGPDFHVILSQIQEPERFADFVLSHLNLKVSEAQDLLEKETILDLLKKLNTYINEELELSTVQEKIQSETRDSINKSQKEYYLREQLRAIQKELGDEDESEVENLKKKAVELPLTDEAREEITRQVRRLEKTAPDSMEATVLRNHIEWVLALPWGNITKDDTDIEHAKKVLDEDHYGLNEIKERILDFLSIRHLKEDSHTPILCFSGPPGVGKTSLGKSIAKCLGRKFFRLSLGGVHDESEIRGHRRTYVGALPGRFVQALRSAGSMNPLIMIDEIDKIGSSQRGDPSAALLEVLDPEQNDSFYDNYLGIHLDLSKTLFITTANDLSTIPGPLRDRMEIIQLPGYLIEEKVEIAKRHLVNKAILNAGLEEKGFSIEDEIIADMVEKYTRESGVRELERFISKLCSKYARGLVEGNPNLKFTRENLRDFLGPRRIGFDENLKGNKIGVTNGLAWTPYGGEVMQVEAVLMPGNGKLILTGQLGDVMKESAQAALTYIKSHADKLGVDQKMFTEKDLHIHLPAGAIPKDGPSAGITLVSSILSVFINKPINGEYAMTGEVNLQGGVMPIGGLKEKILAAKRRGLTHIILPKSNQEDLIDDLHVIEGIIVHWVEDVAEVLDQILVIK
ncbi:MAG: endopeptidase La [bacterium]